MSIKRKKIAISGVFLSLLVIAGLLLMRSLQNRPHFKVAEPVYTIPRQILFGYTLKNTTNRIIPKAELWVYGPVFQTATQKCAALETSQPHEGIKDGLGNQIIHFTFENFPPYGTRIVRVQADLLLSKTPNRLSDQGVTSFLAAEKYLESDHLLIMERANELKTGSNSETVTAIFNWVAGQIHYAGYLSRDRGALYALRNRKGDCTEYAYLFAALARARKIPARTMGGYICRGSAVLKASGYHNWAEFMEEGIWKLADPQNRMLRKTPLDYVAMRIMGDQGESPMGDHHRFRFKGEGLKVRMN